jgi:glycogen synthase
MFNITYGENFAQAILKSEKIFKDKKNWNVLIQNAFKSNFSWDKSSVEYEKMYNITVLNKQNENIFTRS